MLWGGTDFSLYFALSLEGAHTPPWPGLIEALF
jgi:hypothetical protein